MKQIKIMVLSKRKIKKNILILTVSIIGIYIVISIYFINHFYFHTEINGVNVSLKAHNNVLNIMKEFIHSYDLQLLERNGDIEVITSREIGMQYNKNNNISHVKQLQNPFLWIGSLFKSNKYYVKDLYKYNKTLLDNKINKLNCLNEKFIEQPQSVKFKYSDGSYEIIKENNGNLIKADHFVKAINSYIVTGRTKLDLNKMNCYVNPMYTLQSEKTYRTQKLLNKYVATKITYRFGSVTEQLDGTIIHHWLIVDENLEVILCKQAVTNYTNALSKKYNTVGITREFQTSTGKNIELKGGLYGWKINRDAETEALFNHIKHGDVIEKEPIYSQKAFSREGNEIGNTYVEVNITKQHLWFYQDGKLIVQGSIVTGNPYRGNATLVGVYMINYKQKDVTLTGPDYESKVNYWMPFFGNIGLHDATWRYRFGGEIYKRNGSHGCVNLPLYIAKRIFEVIEEGTPVIIYEESM